jgi:hypothetical protein
MEFITGFQIWHRCCLASLNLMHAFMATIPAKPLHLYQVIGGNTVTGTGDQNSQQRFLNELKYIDFFAKKIGECLSMNTLEMSVVEDADTQTAFFYAHAKNGEVPVVNGYFSSSIRPLNQIADDFRREN